MPSSQSHLTSRTVRVLVADDDAAIGRAWRLLLGSTILAEVVTVEDGGAALTRLSEAPFDLLVTDQRMPLVSGLDVLRYARARWPKMPALLVSGDFSPQVRAEACRLRVPLVQKPFTHEDALRAVSRALGSDVGADRASQP